MFNQIASVLLLPGQTYVLEGVSGTIDNYAYDDNGVVVNAPITIDGINWVYGGANTFNGTGPINDTTGGRLLETRYGYA